MIVLNVYTKDVIKVTDVIGDFYSGRILYSKDNREEMVYAIHQNDCIEFPAPPDSKRLAEENLGITDIRIPENHERYWNTLDSCLTYLGDYARVNMEAHNGLRYIVREMNDVLPF